jgi:selenocysteine-specific elongation factor
VTVLVTAGHVDHGKSALVRALTGTDPDRLAEERQRGLTIDLGFAHMTLPSGAALSFVDVPGHERFVHNMLAGVGGVAGCVFVVDAVEGWKPQSEEHLRILELLGVERGVVVLTKADLVDASLRELADDEVADHVRGTFLADAPRLAVSSRTGDGLVELVAELDRLVAASVPDLLPGSRTRLWIDRSFTAAGSGTVVTGTSTGAALHVGDRVLVEPGARSARIRGIQTAGSSVDTIGAGERVALNLVGVRHDEVGRGMAVVDPGRWRLTDRFDAALHVIDQLGHDVTGRGAYVVHVGSGEHPARVRVLGPGVIAPGGDGHVRVFVPQALPLLPGDRYVLRESGRAETVGGGEVLDTDPLLPARQARPDRSVARVVAERGWVTVDELELLTGEPVTPTVGAWVTTPDELTRLTAALRTLLDDAGSTGVDVAALDDRQRALIATWADVSIDAGVARPRSPEDPYGDHPALDELRAGGLRPPDLQLPRNEVRELVRRGHVVERDGVIFHRDAIDDAVRIAADLLAAEAAGYTIARFRDVTGTTRKYALALVAELDARGVTRRRDDLHVAGPRLPDRRDRPDG